MKKYFYGYCVAYVFLLHVPFDNECLGYLKLKKKSYFSYQKPFVSHHRTNFPHFFASTTLGSYVVKRGFIGKHLNTLNPRAYVRSCKCAQ